MLVAAVVERLLAQLAPVVLGVVVLALHQIHLQQMVLQTQAVEGVVNGRMRPLMFLEKAAPVS